MIVKLLGEKQEGDVLSLRSGYDTSKLTPDWKESVGELWLDIGSGVTEAELRTALGLLELKTKVSTSASTRKLWVYPILTGDLTGKATVKGVIGFRHRVDETAGLVRYYLHDVDRRGFASASRTASERILFGKEGYLGLPTSDAEKIIYRSIMQFSSYGIHLAISDSLEEGKWLITAGPREGQLFWDHTANPKVYGPGAAGSGWSAKDKFWNSGEPRNSANEDYARGTVGSGSLRGWLQHHRDDQTP